MFKGHYSSDKKKRRKNKLFIGPGEKLPFMWLTENEPQALIVFRKEKFRKDRNKRSVEIAIFHNRVDSKIIKASKLILLAEQLAL